jgi:uncharacterized protein with beta-barrel porin domain
MLGSATALVLAGSGMVLAQSIGGPGGGNNGGNTGGAGGAYQQNGSPGAAGTNGGGGGGPGAVATAGGAPGNNDAGGGGIGGINGATAAAVPAGSFVGGNGGNATPAVNATTVAGGGGGAGGYGLALTTAGAHTTSAGQIFTGGIGGAANGSTNSGLGGGGGGGILLELGGTFTNVLGASATGGAGGTTPTRNTCIGLCVPGGDGLTTSNYAGAVRHTATVTNAGALTGGTGGAVVVTPGIAPDSSASRAFNGGSGIGFLGGGTITNTASGVITGGVGGAGFAGTPTQGATAAGDGGSGIRVSGGGLITNSGRITGGAGAIGTVAALGSRPSFFAPLSGISPFDGGLGGNGINGFFVNGLASAFSIVNNATGVISGGAGGDAGSGQVNPASPQPLAGFGLAGGNGVQIANGSILNFGSILGGAAGRSADATAAGQVGGSSRLFGFGGTGIVLDGQLSGGALSVDNRGMIAGGRGSTPGASGAGAVGANGGRGGHGIQAIQRNADPIVIANSGQILGGNGAAGSAGTTNGTNGAGGIGILMDGDATITTSGAISGGLGGDGVTRANAITFQSGVHTLTLQTGATFTGNVVIDTAAGGVSASNTLNLDGTGAVSLSQFQNFGHLTQASGAWTLSGTGGFTVNATLSAGTLVVAAGSTLTTPAVNINGGTLSANGTIASNLTVNAGGTLGGNGIVGNSTINGGTLSPGNSIGLLTVQGNLVFTAASSYLVEVSPANADRTNVTGTATLGGATVNASFAAGTYVAKQYTIVNATGGVIGTFNGPVNSNLPGGFKSSLSYDGNNAFLNLALDFTPTPTPTPTGLNVNQTNVANALTGFFNRTGGIPMVFGSLTPAGLTQVSGELPTASQQATFDAMGMFVGLLTDPFVGGRGDTVTAGASAAQFAETSDAASAYASNGKPRSKDERDAYAAIYRKAPPLAPFVPSWSVWAAGYGGSQTTDGNTALGSNNTRSSIGGVAVGADYRFSPNTLAGFAVAGGGTNFSVNGLGSGRSDLFQAGAFVRHTVGPAYLAAALAYGWQDITTDRTVTIAGTDVLRAKFNANAFSGRVEGGYRFVSPWMAVGITPYAAGQFTTFDLPAYAEQVIAGGNTFALSYAAKDVTASRSELGLRSDKSYAMQNGIFTLRGRAAWAHNFNTDRNVGATFQTLPGASFIVNGAQQASDSALVTASAEMKWINGFSLAGTFEGEFSTVTTSYAGKGVVRYAW